MSVYEVKAGTRIHADESGEFAVVVLLDGNRFHLNASACRVLSGVSRGMSLNEITVEFSVVYGLAERKAFEDVSLALAKMCDVGVLSMAIISSSDREGE